MPENVTEMCLNFSSLQIEEVPGEMTQEDLAPDDVMILDTWDKVNSRRSMRRGVGMVCYSRKKNLKKKSQESKKSPFKKKNIFGKGCCLYC